MCRVGGCTFPFPVGAWWGGALQWEGGARVGWQGKAVIRMPW